MRWIKNLSTNLSYVLDNDFSIMELLWQTTAQEHAYKSQHEIILIDLNQYTEKHCAC